MEERPHLRPRLNKALRENEALRGQLEEMRKPLPDQKKIDEEARDLLVATADLKPEPTD